MKHSSVSIERVRDFWNRRPCNIRHSTKLVGSQDYFREVEARRDLVEPHIQRFARYLCWKGKKVLELGCGIGIDAVRFARSGALVTAVELSGKSLEVAREWARISGLENRIRFYEGNAEELDQFLPIEPYDLVFAQGVIHHTPHPEKVVEQIRCYIGPESAVKFMVYHRYSWKVLWILLTYGKGQFWRAEELVARYSEAQTGCPVSYTYSPREIRRLLSGYEILDIWIDHIFPYRIPDYIKHQYIREWYFRWMPGSLFRWLEQHFGWHLCVTARPI